MGAVQSRTFKSGDGVAVRLPAELAFEPDTLVTIERNGDVLTIRPANGAVPDPEEVKRQLAELMSALEAIGPPPDGIQPREPFDDPERPGL